MRTKAIVKKIIVAFVVVSILLSPSYKPVLAATKLSADDFVAKVNSESETWSFFEELKSAEMDEGVLGFGYDKAYDKSKKGVVTTSRGINIGSKSSTVIKKYGKGTKLTLSKDIVYKGFPEDSRSCFSTTEYVLTYKYVEKTEAGGEYTSIIHFYIDKNKKVDMIFFSRTLKN